MNLRPDGEIPAGLTFVSMAAALGLGGYFPTLIMGATYNPQDNSYFIGLMLLVVTALIAFVFTIVGVRTPPPTTAALKGSSGRQR